MKHYNNLEEETREFIEGAICFILVVVVLFGGMSLLNWDYFSIINK